MSDVLLVNMPFSNLRWPNLGTSLLKAALAAHGTACDLAYLNFDFAERVGVEHYDWIADHFAFVLGGERLFSRHYFARPLPADNRYYEDVLLGSDAEITTEDRHAYERTEEHVEPFLDWAMRSIDWSRYAIVGFATSFQQTMPSLCLAQRIKRRHPHMQVVLGGAACEGEMGLELLRQFPEIDYVFLGEADRTFVPVVERILAGGSGELPPGVAGRERNPNGPPTCKQALTLPEAASSMVRDMDGLPYPDFDDYFARVEASPLRDRVDSLLFFETSRGCWWGQKHHCLFCGLNGASLAYRSKTARRAVDELRYLVRRHGIRRACSADNILDHRYFDSFLPMLKEAGLDLAFVYEMKTNLTRAQVQMLLDAGMGAAQLGIETFIPSVLKLINKGATAAHNLQALKWFSEADIEVKWNILYGFPNEHPEDYRVLADLLPSLVHLAPPMAVGRVRLDRFSPYFESPTDHGMCNPRPNQAFRHVYPFPADVLARMAYYYEYDYADGRDPLDYAGPILEQVEHWRALAGTVTLRYWDRPDGVLILTDTRPCAAVFQRRLTGVGREVYLYCDSSRSFRTVHEFAVKQAGAQDLREQDLRRVLDEWVDARIMACLEGRYLSLAIRAPEEG